MVKKTPIITLECFIICFYIGYTIGIYVTIITDFALSDAGIAISGMITGLSLVGYEFFSFLSLLIIPGVIIFILATKKINLENKLYICRVLTFVSLLTTLSSLAFMVIAYLNLDHAILTLFIGINVVINLLVIITFFLMRKG